MEVPVNRKNGTYHDKGTYMIRPIIGITADRSDESNNIESHFHVRRNYCAAVSAAGGLPVVLPYDMEAVNEYSQFIDGLIVTGGMFDIDPAEYGMTARHPDKVTVKRDRTNFERALLRRALGRDLPILGICGGMQLIAVELGAKLHQHLPSDIATDIEHKQFESCSIGTHRIRIEAGTYLHRILGTDTLVINSLHHQAVISGNKVLHISATADDGVIESIEVPGQTFCLGVQWHPEYLVNASEGNIFAELVRTSALAKGLASGLNCTKSSSTT